MMQLGSSLFDERSQAGGQRPFCQIMLIISDGRFNKAKVQSWVHSALARQQLPLLVIVDSAPEASSQTGGKCNVVPYLQDFPFPYYVVVQDLQALPNILSD